MPRRGAASGGVERQPNRRPIDIDRLTEPKTCHGPRDELRDDMTTCGRPVHAGHLCRSHYRQDPTGVRLQPIRPYYEKADLENRRVKLWLRVKPATSEAIRAAAKSTKLSTRTVGGAILDHWAEGKLWQGWRGRLGVGAVVAVVLAASVGMTCAGAHRGEAEVCPPASVLSRPMPAKPLEGQATPPCAALAVEINGGCWLAVHDRKAGAQARGCLMSEVGYADKDDWCWTPSYAKPKPPSNAISE